VNNRGTVFGTYIHGLFDNQSFTNGLIRNMCRLRGLSGVIHMAIDRENSYDKLADLVRSNLDMQKIYDIIAGGRNGR
jgi:adenosylcobyric acid synthase